MFECFRSIYDFSITYQYFPFTSETLQYFIALKVQLLYLLYLQLYRVCGITCGEWSHDYTAASQTALLLYVVTTYLI